MPCQSDYLAASGQELESSRVCRLLVYLMEATGQPCPEWVRAASKDYYGNVNRLDEATKMLCEACRKLVTAELEKFVYDSHNTMARELASWWERHQEWDARRVKEEKETRKRIVLKERALRKLTNEEIEALGL
jgi:hypothetical protein